MTSSIDAARSSLERLRQAALIAKLRRQNVPIDRVEAAIFLKAFERLEAAENAVIRSRRGVFTQLNQLLKVARQRWFV